MRKVLAAKGRPTGADRFAAGAVGVKQAPNAWWLRLTVRHFDFGQTQEQGHRGRAFDGGTPALLRGDKL